MQLYTNNANTNTCVDIDDDLWALHSRIVVHSINIK